MNDDIWIRGMAEAFARFAAALQEASNTIGVNFALLRLSIATDIPTEALFSALDQEHRVSATYKSFVEYIDWAYWYKTANGKLPKEIAQHFRHLTDDGRKYLEEGDNQ